MTAHIDIANLVLDRLIAAERQNVRLTDQAGAEFDRRLNELMRGQMAGFSYGEPAGREGEADLEAELDKVNRSLRDMIEERDALLRSLQAREADAETLLKGHDNLQAECNAKTVRIDELQAELTKVRGALAVKMAWPDEIQGFTQASGHWSLQAFDVQHMNRYMPPDPMPPDPMPPLVDDACVEWAGETIVLSPLADPNDPDPMLRPADADPEEDDDVVDRMSGELEELVDGWLATDDAKPSTGGGRRGRP